MHGTEAPSSWVTRWTPLLTPHSHVLDLACGAGRHMQWLAHQGHHCLGIDRSAEALSAAKAFGQVMEADIEDGPWPLTGQTFDAVIVTNYLWRPLLPRILESLKPQGFLIYETFALGHEKIGKPSRPDFCSNLANCCRLARKCTSSPTRTAIPNSPQNLSSESLPHRKSQHLVIRLALAVVRMLVCRFKHMP